jgi:F-type H+-transporting ATPase subunit beta
MDVIRTRFPIMVPVGESALAVYDVLGNPIDGKGEILSEEYYPLHHAGRILNISHERGIT